jgi:tungstate transport system substrate-binding protein
LLKNPAPSLQIIVNSHPFVSRGDDLGTHRRERSIWTEAGLNPEDGEEASK